MPFALKSLSVAAHVSVAAASKVVPLGNPMSEWRSGFSSPFL